MIPKIIYHIWLSNKEENELQKKCVDSWKKLGYYIHHITLDNVLNTSQFVRECLATGTVKGWVKANDYLRIQYLYEQGGLYFDNDVEVLKSFDPLLNNDCFLAAEDGNAVNMAVMGAEKGSWLLKEWLDEVDENYKGYGDESPVFTLQVMTRILKKYGWAGNVDFEINGVKVFDNKPFYPSHYSNKHKLNITDETYTIHHWEKSWG